MWGGADVTQEVFLLNCSKVNNQGEKNPLGTFYITCLYSSKRATVWNSTNETKSSGQGGSLADEKRWKEGWVLVLCWAHLLRCLHTASEYLGPCSWLMVPLMHSLCLRGGSWSSRILAIQDRGRDCNPKNMMITELSGHNRELLSLGSVHGRTFLLGTDRVYVEQWTRRSPSGDCVLHLDMGTCIQLRNTLSGNPGLKIITLTPGPIVCSLGVMVVEISVICPTKWKEWNFCPGSLGKLHGDVNSRCPSHCLMLVHAQKILAMTKSGS